MKIAIVSEHIHPIHRPSGQGVHVHALSCALGRAGNDVTVYTPGDETCVPARVRLSPRVTVERVPAPGRRDVVLSRLAQHLRKHWRRDAPDVVHSHRWMGGLAALAGTQGLDTPVVTTLHDMDNGRTRVERAVAGRSDSVIANSRDEAERVRHLKVPRKRIRVVPGGIDDDVFCPHGPAAARGSRPRLLYVGELEDAKGVGTLIAALPRIPDAELVLAGGPEPDELAGDQKAVRVRRAAERAGVADRVTLLGRISHAEMPALMRSADLVVSVPRRSRVGLAPIEAMACGVPVVTTPVGGHLDSVLDGVTGIHVWPPTPAELARGIRRLLADSYAMQGLGIAAADRAQSRYSMDRIVRETLSVYEGVIRERDAA